MSPRPFYINFLPSIFHDTPQLLFTHQAEKIIAQHRKIEQFTWAENFGNTQMSQDEKQFLQDRLVCPYRIALCYFGETIGYAPIAVERIFKGKLLLFTGEILNQVDQSYATNPYISSINGLDWVEAKQKAGYSGFLMDLPSVHLIRKLKHKKRLPTDADVATANFKAVDIGCLAFQAMRTIEPGEILGFQYSADTHLQARAFNAFQKNKEPLLPAYEQAIQHATDKLLLRRHFTKQMLALRKLIKYSTQADGPQLLSLLRTNIRLLPELTQGELTHIADCLKQAYADSTGTLKLQYQHVARSLTHALAAHTQPAEVKPYLRKLTDKLAETNQKQFAARGTTVALTAEGLFIIYSEIVNDFIKIAKYYNKLEAKQASLTFMNHALFFGINFPTETGFSKNQEIEINTHIATLLK